MTSFRCLRVITSLIGTQMQPTHIDGSIWTKDAAGHETELTSGGNDSSPAWQPRAAQ